MEYIMQKESIKEIVDIIKIFVICISVYYMNFKIINKKAFKNIREKITIIVICFILAIFCKGVKETIDFLYAIVIMFFSTGCLYSIKNKSKLVYSIMITMISTTINYIMLAISIFLDFILVFIFNIQNEYVNMIFILTIFANLTILFYKVKRIKKGFSFLQTKLENEYFDILIFDICCLILFSITILSNYGTTVGRKLIMGLIIFIILMFITIQKSLQLYYKQRMLVKDLEETKEELENKKKEVEQLEKENLEFSKVSHSIAHKQKSLEYKLNELSMKNEIADEIDIKDRIKNLNKGIKEENILVLDRTGITQIDDMLIFMQSECVKNKIDFQLQLSGNIYTMINHYIDKDELEILLADHIKNAIIAIGYGDNINKSILVRLGKLDGNYGLYIYDSGIEFEIETLLNLGKKPSTTHKDSGGTGMGFMNTFDTLKKNKASFIIEEYGKPIKDNFTKALKFKFDNNCEFKIYSYREEQIKIKDKENDLVVEKLPF